MGKVYVIQGGQFGSEGKGGVVNRIASMGRMGHCVRTGSINAGHTFYRHGTAYKMQQIPAAWDSPGTQLYIGPGAYIHPDILRQEMEYDPTIKDRLMIDYRAGLHLPWHEEVAKDANRHHLIGATGKGCAEAIINKIQNRGSGAMLFKEWREQQSEYAPQVSFGDVPLMLNKALAWDQDVWIEGTQGTGLDLHLGPYPYTTSRMTTAANWVAEAGLSPALDIQVILVVRTFPIRVAGNSGPMANEIEWWNLWNLWRGLEGGPPQVSIAAASAYAQLKYKIRADLEKSNGANYAESEAPSKALLALPDDIRAEVVAGMEMTTVTKKPRRIAEIDYDQIVQTAIIERPSRLVVTFLNYKFPYVWGMTRKDKILAWPGVRQYLDHLSEITGAPVWMVTTGPEQHHHVVVGAGV